MEWDDQKMKAQKAEFDTVVKLCKCYNDLPPIVDDYYPEARHYYELAMRGLIDTINQNGRL